MTEYFALCITFAVILLCFVPVMVIAHWPEKYNKVLKTRKRVVHIGRNDLCPCRSGKKLKKCCIDKYNNSYIIERWWHLKPGVRSASERFTSLKNKVMGLFKRGPNGKGKLFKRRKANHVR